MASYKDCLDTIVAAAGRDLTAEELTIVERHVTDAFEQMDAKGGVLADQVEEVLASQLDEIRAQAYVQKRNKMKNIKIKLGWDAQLEKTWGDNPLMGFRAMIDGVHIDREGAKNSLQRAISGKKDFLRSVFVSKIEKEGLLEISRRGTLDEDIWRIQSLLTKDDVTPEALAAAKRGVPKEAVRLAEIYAQTNEFSRRTANEAGALIKKHQGYVTKQSHDMYTISHAAGRDIPVNDPRHFEAWKQDIMDNFDLHKSFPDAKPERHNAILKSLFEQFSNGRHLSFSDAQNSGLKGYANFGRKMSHARVLIGKNADAEFAYHKKYSGASSLGESLFEGLSVVGKDIAIMEHLGPNARQNFDDLASQWTKKLEKRGDLKGAAKFEKEIDRLRKKSWPVYTGELGISVNESVSRWSERFRSLQVMSDLGSALLSSVNDINNAATLLNYYGDRTFTGYLKNTAHIAKTVFADVPFSEKIKVAGEAGILMDGVFSMALDMTDPTMPGTMHKATELTMKFSGIRWMTNKMRSASMTAYAVRQAQYSNTAFGKLPDGMQAAMRQFNLGADDWDIIRSAKGEAMSDGNRILTPEALDDLADDVFSGATTAQQQASRKKIQNNYRLLFHEVANSAATVPSLATKAIMLQGTERGSFGGEMMRHGGLFKSYIVSYMREHMARELYGYHPDQVGLAQALKRIVTGQGGGAGKGIATLIAGGVFWGGVSNGLHDIAKGKEPQIPHDLESTGRIVQAAMLRSGAIGLYGDILFGDAATNVSGAERLFGLAGPSARRAGQLVDVFDDFKEGKIRKDRLFKTFYDLVPGRSLFYTKAATDYMILYRMSEMLNPGYLRRMERRLKKQDRPEFIIDPSDVVG